MAEPILWAHKAEKLRKIPARRWNPEAGAMEEAFDDDTGQPVYEKIPQRGHVAGDYDNPVPSPHARWLHVLRHDGHVVRVPLTCAAADLDGAQLTSQERRAKARHFGWIPVGSCPLAMVETGELKAGQLIAKAIRGQEMCKHGSYGPNKPCPHYIAEEAARKELQKKATAKREKAHQSEADKLVAAQADQTKEIVGAITDALGKKKG
ncbi:MAG TPA: hypothetical protein VMY88_01570 [Acidimicrobiales bacterium]|nr:hypothetical protein [Acidimicrobiales bacterium]